MADPSQVVGLISNVRTEHGIPQRVSCRALGVSESWFYKRRTHRTTARQIRHLRSVDAIKEEFSSSGGTCGSPKIWIALVRQGWRVLVNTIAKIMAELGLAGRAVRRRRGLTRPGKRPAAPDFVRRDFTTEAPDVVWCGETTEIDTGEGELYPATVIDLFSRRLLGCAMGARHDAELARIRIATWITNFYSTRRLHSVCDWKSPIDYGQLQRGTGCCGEGSSHPCDLLAFGVVRTRNQPCGPGECHSWTPPRSSAHSAASTMPVG
ncbi:IS3 family transposase [Streptomyces olivochromogenes]|uniref:IS3 family transposase n=1 Tax=Streptomyces olivochromogenes TaxID=1963 RepID=UPI0036D7DE1B